MPRGRVKYHHKGRAKRYQTPEETQEQEERRKREADWKRKKGLPGEGEAEDESGDKGAVGGGEGAPRDIPPGSSEEEEEEESSGEEIEHKPKGVESLIEVENPNRVAGKMKKAKDIDVHAKVELTRREREEIQRQRDATNYRRMHEAGRTDEAMRDMARLALIRQQREEAAKKREADKKAKDASQTEARERQLQQQKNRAK